MKHTITMKEIQDIIKNGVSTFSKKDNSPRGCSTVFASEEAGDKILIGNYFTTVVDEQDQIKDIRCQYEYEKERVDKLDIKMGILRDTIIRLQSENEVLQNDNENLIADLQDYETENAKLIAENEVLQNKITNLENENDELRTQLHQYKALFADIEQSMTVSLYESLLGKAAN